MSDSSSKLVSIVEQIRNAPKPPDKSADKPDRKYKAYGVDAPQRRPTLVAIHYGNGQISLMQKSFLTEALFTSHQHVSLIYTNCIITLEGRNLDQLVDLLQDEKVLSLHCFNPKLHDKPDDDEILITKVERRSAAEIIMKKEKTG